jgi:hypothetical protein
MPCVFCNLECGGDRKVCVHCHEAAVVRAITARAQGVEPPISRRYFRGTAGGKSIKFEAETRIRVPAPKPPRTLWERLDSLDIL